MQWSDSRLTSSEWQYEWTVKTLRREMCVPGPFNCLWKEEMRQETEFQPWTAALWCSTRFKVILGLSLMTFQAAHITQTLYAWSSMTSKIWITKSEIARKSSFPCSLCPLSFLQFKVTIVASSALFHNRFADALAVVWVAILHHKTKHVFGRVSMQICKN